MALQDDYVRTALRLPREMHTRIHEAASAAGHSFNAEIIRRLELTLPPPGDTPIGEALIKELREMNLRMSALHERIQGTKP